MNINPSTVTNHYLEKPLNIQTNNTNKYVNFANIICSRESTYRTFLDLVSFDLPAMLASGFRNYKNFFETTFECLYGTCILFTSPLITSTAAKVSGKFILRKDLQINNQEFLKFSMQELQDLDSLKKGIKRIAKEEVEDKKFIASLFRKAKQESRAKKHDEEAKHLNDFCCNFSPTEKTLNQIKKLKKTVIIIESFIEGSWASSVAFATRLFRKHVLKESRFTGTKDYVSAEESKKICSSVELSLFQKGLTIAMCFISPITNSILLNKVENKKAVENNRFLKMIHDQFDMTHGVYPKLGLLLSYTVPPKWISNIFLSQGYLERGEKILKFLTVASSWWFGHRFTNGLLAKKMDQVLAKKYNINNGILVEPEYLQENKNDNLFLRIKNRFPEPAKINHVFKTTEAINLDREQKENLKKEAEEKHAKCLYLGFTLHAAIVWGINMVINHITKLRAKWILGVI